MKLLLLIIGASLSAVFVSSCKKCCYIQPPRSPGNWVHVSDLNMPARSEAVVFTFPDYAYIGSG